VLKIVGGCQCDAEGAKGGNARNTRLEGQGMSMVSCLDPHQVVVKQPRIL
jgi:hypothetical protein